MVTPKALSLKRSTVGASHIVLYSKKEKKLLLRSCGLAAKRTDPNYILSMKAERIALVGLHTKYHIAINHANLTDSA